MTIKTNLAALIEQRNLNPTRLAKEFGIPQPTIHRILTPESPCRHELSTSRHLRPISERGWKIWSKVECR